jgi:hypothetical protein
MGQRCDMALKILSLTISTRADLYLISTGVMVRQCGGLSDRQGQNSSFCQCAPFSLFAVLRPVQKSLYRCAGGATVRV